MMKLNFSLFMNSNTVEHLQLLVAVRHIFEMSSLKSFLFSIVSPGIFSNSRLCNDNA